MGVTNVCDVELAPLGTSTNSADTTTSSTISSTTAVIAAHTVITAARCRGGESWFGFSILCSKKTRQLKAKRSLGASRTSRT